MSIKKLMAVNSFALVNNTVWIGIPKVATTSLFPVLQKHSPTYFNDNTEFLNVAPNTNEKKLWCVWRDPWQRWLSAVMQDYEYKFDMGVVRSGIKHHRHLSDKEIVEIHDDLSVNWKFRYSNITNKKYKHSGIMIARYITLLWNLTRQRFNCPQINFYPLHKINQAVKDMTGHEDTIGTLNVSNTDNTHRLGLLLKEKNFFDKWKTQYEEDLLLDKYLKKISIISYEYWNENIIGKNRNRYNKISIGKIQ